MHSTLTWSHARPHGSNLGTLFAGMTVRGRNFWQAERVIPGGSAAESVPWYVD